MREMVYTEEFQPPIVLDYGFHKGRRYWVISYGHHPCCYTEVLPRDVFYHVDYDQIKLDVHGGMNFSDSNIGRAVDKDYVPEPSLKPIITKSKVWLLGWDYAHAGDFTVTFSERLPYEQYGLCLPKEKQWTTEELHTDCLKAIDQVHAFANVWE